MKRALLFLAVIVPLTLLANAVAPASASVPHRPKTVGVLLADQDTDGNPLEVPRASVSHVHTCKGHGLAITCLAKLEGYRRPVRVAGVDFPVAAKCQGLRGEVRKVCAVNVRHGASWQHTGAIDGHAHCGALVGDTTVYRCRDGFSVTS